MRWIIALFLMMAAPAIAQVNQEVIIVLGAPPHVTPANTNMQFIAGTAADNSNGGIPSSVTINAPAGIQAGDVMVACIVSGDLGTAPLTSPTGWNSITTTTLSNGFGMQLFWKVATASEPTTYTWGNGYGPFATIRDYRPVNNTNPVDQFASGGNLSSASATIPAMPATKNAGEYYIGCWWQFTASYTFTLPSDLGNVISDSGGGNTIYSADKAMGAAGSAVPAETATESASDTWLAMGVTITK